MSSSVASYTYTENSEVLVRTLLVCLFFNVSTFRCSAGSSVLNKFAVLGTHEYTSIQRVLIIKSHFYEEKNDLVGKLELNWS